MLEVEDLHVQYGHIAALKGVCLSIQAREIFAVLGANGAGKTSLLRSILGLAGAAGGIRFEGEDIARLPTAQRVRRGIAMVPEGRRLFADFSVADNLRIGAFNRRDGIAVERDLDEICEIFPILKARFRQQSHTLSGGEGQMLAIGRALMSRPKLLLLDEPSVGLMPTAVSEIFKMIGDVPQKNGITVLIVEQNTRKTLQIANRAAVLELGRVAFEGPVESVAADPRVKEAYLGG
jgi:branched-chain amino acid transport system ATP-binding protein